MKRGDTPDPSSSNEDVLPSERICSRCAMTKEEWSGNHGRGVIEAGEVYCCQGCADDTGCTCDSDRVEEDTEEETPKPSKRS
jgi:hypothetical protein